MAKILWPSSLPQDVLRDGYGETAQAPKYSVQTDNSQPIERPKTTLRAVKITCAMDMTDAQLALFENFVFSDLGQGAEEFYMLHPRLRRQVRCKITGDEPYSTQQMTPGYGSRPARWKIAMTLMVYP